MREETGRPPCGRIETGMPDRVPGWAGECWFVTRTFKGVREQDGAKVRHVPALAPSSGLMAWASGLKKRGAFGRKERDRFAAGFLREMEGSRAAGDAIRALAGTGEDVLLVCYCAREDCCHRAIVKRLAERERELYCAREE